ncbi:MAG: acetate--CoA ligase [Euryarchaeota archaeon RBG_19FT_COMBO_56_21]|nr:MAG: acetate--CoA ligase [Euryarchaeota archaeon RBG_19FT_COMBO_56_21]
MHGQIVKKDPARLRLKPNLQGFEQLRKTFKWSDADKMVEWFPGGKINAAYNCIDRHAKGERKDKIALIFDDGEGNAQKFTFGQLNVLTNKFANLLKKLDIKRQDRIFFFLSRSPELYVGFIGAIKYGAIASPMFPAFGPDAIRDRLQDSGAVVLVTDSALKKRVYEVKSLLPELKHMVIVGKDVAANEISWEEEMAAASDKFDATPMDPEEFSYMLYTSGTTGKPKGVMHAHKDIVQVHLSTYWVLDVHDEDVYWCTADLGWVTGVVYGCLGPWSNGVTQVGLAGRFDPERWYKTIQAYKITIWYTAPTAVRMLMAKGDDLPMKYDLSSLRVLYSVGEPLNPEGVKWALDVFDLKPFHDTWWQTETGSILITNFPEMDIKPGSMGKPLPGVEAAILGDSGNVLPQGEEGSLAIRPGWPSMMRQIWNNPAKYSEYFRNGWYYTGDTAQIDKDGYFWYVGRADDVIKTAGERVGPFEVESALIEHPAVAEAGVIGKPDELRGNIIKAFIVLTPGFSESPQLKEDIQKFVKTKLAGHAYPREIEIVKSLPKTRSGKIMRRMLRAKDLGLPIGDTSTLDN